MTLQNTFYVPRYRLKEDFRRTLKGVETIVPKGAHVTPVQEIIHYGKRTQRVQIVYKPEGSAEIIVWVHKKILATLR